MPKNQMYTAKEIKAINKKAQILKDRVFYNIRSILGNNDCIFYFLLRSGSTSFSALLLSNFPA